MSKIIAYIYAEPSVPAEVYSEVHRLQNKGWLDLLDVTEVEVRDNGKLKFEQAMTIPLLGSSSGLFLPALIGLIFFQNHRVANEQVQKALNEINLDQNFMTVLETEVAPRNSILFLHVGNERTDVLLRAMTEHGGRAVAMSLSARQEEMLQRLFKGQSLRDPQFSMHI